VNYIESHDGYTLGDFIRIATGEVPADAPASPAGGPPYDARITPRQLVLNRFAALALLTSPGPVMVHEGQEFARAKVIAGTGASDPDAGRLDHNSYNKDDATNHLDFAVRDANRELFDYYRDLIRLRKRHPDLCRARTPASVEVRGDDGLLTVSTIGASGRFNRYIIVLNASTDHGESVGLPPGRWTLLADGTTIYPEGDGPIAGPEAVLPPSSGMVLGGVDTTHANLANQD
jgi:pullulanase/glycogen debranching enzyme